MTVAKLAAGQSIASITTKTSDSLAIVLISRWWLNYVKSGVWLANPTHRKAGNSALTRWEAHSAQPHEMAQNGEVIWTFPIGPINVYHQHEEVFLSWSPTRSPTMLVRFPA